MKRCVWRKHRDESGVWWEIDIPLGAGIVNIVVSVEEDEGPKWGYLIADGGGHTIRGVASRFETLRDAKIDALGFLEQHLHNTKLLVRNLITAIPK
jgi:hypothetical protein